MYWFVVSEKAIFERGSGGKGEKEEVCRVTRSSGGRYVMMCAEVMPYTQVDIPSRSVGEG